MSFDKFRLGVKSRDLSQADKSVFFPKSEWWVAEILFLSLNNWGLVIEKLKFCKIEKKALL